MSSAGTVLAPLDMSFSLQIENRGLAEFDSLSWTHLILISLCYTLGLCHSFKTCVLPPSLLVHALLLSPVWGHNSSTTFWRDNQKNRWRLGGKCSIIFNLSRYSGLHLPCFLQHVQQQLLSVNPLGQVTDTQHNACQKFICWWHPFKGNLTSRDNVCHFGSQPYRPFGPTLLPLFS